MYVPCIDIDVSRATWMEGDGSVRTRTVRVADIGTMPRGMYNTRERINSCGRSLDWLPHASHASFTHASDLCHVKGFAAATRDDRPSLYAEFSLERLIQLLFGRACNVDG
jgi:hypothetical protein